MPKPSFTEKKLELKITLGSGAFGSSVGDTMTLKGLRMAADISAPGGDSMTQATIKIWGMQDAMMKRLMLTGRVDQVFKLENKVFLSAGDINGMRPAYQGFIYDCWADYNSQPDVPFTIVCHNALLYLIKPAQPTSIQGVADVGIMISSLAFDMGLEFENKDVTATLSNPYFSGTALEQVRAITKAAGIQYAIENGQLTIFNPTSGGTGIIPKISKDTGLIGYPSFSQKIMGFTCLYNPDIRIDGYIEMESSFDMVNGKWKTGPFSHHLSSNLPKGPWHTVMERCFRV